MYSKKKYFSKCIKLDFENCIKYTSFCKHTVNDFTHVFYKHLIKKIFYFLLLFKIQFKNIKNYFILL